MARSPYRFTATPIVRAALFGLVTGCIGTDRLRPGESIGAFSVTAKLVANTCGSVATDPWAFEIRLRHEGSTLYWVQGDAPVAGTVDATAHAVLRTSVTQTLREGRADGKTKPCTLVRSDELDVRLRTRDLATLTAFAGDLRYRFAPTEESSCDEEVVASGGPYATLPCDVHYTLQAQRSGDAP
jgi:hypothetical protein